MNLRELLNKISIYTKQPVESIDLNKPFMEMGFDSRTLVQFIGEIEQELNVKLDLTALIDNPTINKLWDYLNERRLGERISSVSSVYEGSNSEKIAIVGIACKFPGATNLEEFFNNLKNQQLSVIPYPKERRLLIRQDNNIRKEDSRIYDGGYLDGIELFDNAFFNMSKEEASKTDPQQRLLLQEIVHALEDANITQSDIQNRKVGMFVGASSNDYLRTVLCDEEKDMNAIVGNSMAMLSNRMSFFFDFKGPSLTIDTACSSSLVATHKAIESLHNGECDIAIVAGVNIVLDTDLNKSMGEAGMLSPDGLCQTFDENANGYVRGEGIGVVVLKKLSDANLSKDRVYSTIIGKAINQDGRSASLTAPNKNMQVELLKSAVADAGLSPSDINYVETHGTGTYLGDYIEISAIDEALNNDLKRNKKLLVGALKTNIGHLESAAGIASLIKASLSLYHGEIAPTRKVTNLNKKLELKQKNISVVQKVEKLKEDNFYCSVSSFGFGGTNCNIVMEKHSNRVRYEDTVDKEHYIIPFSDVNKDALHRRLATFREFALSFEGSLSDLEYMLTKRTDHRAYRTSFVVKNKEDLISQLNHVLESSGNKYNAKRNKRVSLLFSGQGTQWIGMGRKLIQFPAYREQFEKCVEGFKSIGQCDLNEIIESDDYNIQNDTYLMQPVIFSIQVSLASLLKEIGIEYDTVCGHSLGEVAAAYSSGLISFKSAIKIIQTRSQIMRRLSGKGKMISVSLTEEIAQEYLKEYQNTSIGVINTKESVVISGDNEEIIDLEQKLKNNGVRYKYLPVNNAFHYVGLESYREEFVESVGKIRSKPSPVKYISTVTGEPINTRYLNEEYWANNMINTVQFAQAAEYLSKDSDVVLEVGPSSVLMFYLLSYETIEVIPVQRRNISPSLELLNTVSKVFNLGIEVNWEALNIVSGNRVYLPKYSFSKNKIWPFKYSNQAEQLEEIQKPREIKLFTTEEINKYIIDLIASNIYEDTQVSIESDISDLGIDSLKLFQLNSKINKHFNISLSLKQFSKLNNLKSLVELIKDSLEKEKISPKEIIEKFDEENLVTDGQKAIILDQNFDNRSNKYNMASAWKMQPGLVAEKWKKACEIVINKHVSLNVVFNIKGNDVFQHQKVETFSLSEKNLHNYTELNQELQFILNEPFDISKETVRATLINVDDELYFGISIHHSVIDGISMFYLLKEIISIYKKLVKNESIISEKDLRYLEYQSKQFHRIHSEETEKMKQEVKNSLANNKLVTKFNIYSDVKQNSQDTSEKIIKFSKNNFNRLKKVSKVTKYTLFELLYSTYQLLYYKINQQNNFITCTYSSGRENAEHYDTIGYFVKNILTSNFVNPEETAYNYIERLHNQLLKSYDYPSVASLEYLKNSGIKGEKLGHVFVYEKAMEEIKGAPIFINAPDSESTFVFDDVTFEKVKMNCLDSQYDLVFMVEECTDKMFLRCQFRKSSYSEQAVEVLLQSFELLLENILRNINRPIKEYEITELLPMQVISRQLEGVKYHDYVEYFAKQTPEKLAVCFSNIKLSYYELNEKSNILANEIIKHSHGENVPIGIAIEKSERFLICLFAILKSGAYYVPLDSSYPPERLQYIIDNSGMKYLFLDETFESKRLDLSSLIRLDFETSHGNTNNPNINNGMTSIAYMIYTSGTTGIPKGVRVTHAGIENVVLEQKRLFEVSTNDRCAFFASVSFDASVFEILMAIGHGATLVFDSKEEMGTGARLQSFLQKERITITTLPSSVLASMENKDLAQLRVIVTAGEPCTESIKNKWCIDHDFFNAYGVTEATIWNTTSKCTLEKSVDIGQAIANTSLLILNKDGNNCPVGVSGELFIGGVGLAEGYAGLDKLNQERFINICGRRYYKTGDLVRLLNTEEIEYVGRVDNQVKINGYRIELEEIEKVAQKLTNVRNAIALVVLRGKIKKLVCYVEVDETKNNTEKQLKEELTTLLPKYMIPDRIFTIQEMKLTQNGKIDRKYLEHKALEDLENREVIYATTNEEKQIIDVLKKYVGEEQISVTDTLMELGIGSLNVYNLVVELEEKFSVSLKVEELLSDITVSKLANLIFAGSNGVNLNTVQKKPSFEPIRLTEKQKGIWIASQIKTDSREFNIPICLKLTGVLNVDALDRAFKNIVQKHHILRTEYSLKDGELLGNIVDSPESIISMEDISNHENKKSYIRDAIYEMRTLSLSLDQFPLYKIRLLKTDSEEYHMLFTIHHFISDGWSIKIILDELKEYYNAYCEHEYVVSEPLRYQYEDIAFTESISDATEQREKMRQYWKDKFEESDTVLSMPEDYPRPRVMDHKGKNINKIINAEKYSLIKDLAQSYKTSVFTLMSAVLGILLRRYTGQENINIGFPILGRNDSNAQQMVGMFIDTSIMKLSVETDLDFGQYLEQVSSEILSSIKMSGIGLNSIIETVNPARRTDNTELFQVLINMTDFTINENSLQGLKTAVIEDIHQDSKYDFTFYITEEGQGLHLRLNYYSSVYSQETAQLILNQYLYLMDEITRNSSKKVGQYKLSNKNSVCETDIPSDIEQFTPLFDKAQTNIRNNVDKIRLKLGDHIYSSSDIKKSIDEITGRLLDLEVPKGSVIAIQGLRTPKLIASILAVLKNDYVFTIVDSQWPKAKIESTLEASNCSYYINLTGNDITVNKLSSKSIRYTSGNSSYISITSGTTGRPKCILGNDSAVNHFIDWEIRHFELNDEDKFSMLSGISHDPIIRDIFVPLTLGAEIVFPEKSNLIENDLYSYLESNEITVSHMTPSMAEAVILSSKRHIECNLPKLRFIFLGGERVKKQTVEQLRELAPNCRIINYYGATETPQGVSFIEYDKDLSGFGEYLPIGKGIPNFEIVVVDEEGEEVSIGEIGEICIRSEYLARGYLTEGKNTVTPFSSDAYVYKTGDLGRYRLDGNIDILGRRDSQVKRYGHRVELGEIESAISHYHGVSTVTSIFYSEEIYAFVTSDESFEEHDCTLFIKKYLPQYMLPKRIIRIPQLPLTTNGKVDRRQLEDLIDSYNQINSHVDNAILSEVERKLCDIWKEVLNISSIQIDKSFFDLGGTSMKVLVLQQKMEQQFQVEIPITLLFSQPNIKSLAQFIETRAGELKFDIDDALNEVTKRTEKINIFKRNKQNKKEM